MPWVTHFMINAVLTVLVKVSVLLRSVCNTGVHVRNLPATKASGSGSAVGMHAGRRTSGSAYLMEAGHMGCASLLMHLQFICHECVLLLHAYAVLARLVM